jgi:hypothetical protein
LLVSEVCVCAIASTSAVSSCCTGMGGLPAAGGLLLLVVLLPPPPQLASATQPKAVPAVHNAILTFMVAGLTVS